MNTSIQFIFFSLWILMFMIVTFLVLTPNLNPINMLLYLLFFSMIISLNLSKFASSYLYSYFMFLMMTGGMLILFTFFLSLISNLLITKNFIYWCASLSFLPLLIMTFKKLIILTPSLKMMESNSNYYDFMESFYSNNYYNLHVLYSYPMNLIMIMLIFYLLFSLILITKICLSNNKPLRTKFYE